MIDCILNRVKGFLGIGEVVATATQQVPKETENRRFVVMADPVVMAFFEEQTRNLSERSVELINEYETDDNKMGCLMRFNLACIMRTYAENGKRRDEYYDTCRALIKIFLNNCPAVDDGLGHKILHTEKENERLITWGCCILDSVESLAKKETNNPDLVCRIRQFAKDLMEAGKAIP
jgi:hypothetical protein